MKRWWHTHTHTHSSDLCDAGASESHNDGHDVDSELELKKLGDAVVDVSAPHHRLDDAAEVIVGQNDIRRLLGHVRTSNALKERSAVRKKTGFYYTTKFTDHLLQHSVLFCSHWTKLDSGHDSNDDG